MTSTDGVARTEAWRKYRECVPVGYVEQARGGFDAGWVARSGFVGVSPDLVAQLEVAVAERDGLRKYGMQMADLVDAKNSKIAELEAENKRLEAIISDLDDTMQNAEEKWRANTYGSDPLMIWLTTDDGYIDEVAHFHRAAAGRIAELEAQLAEQASAQVEHDAQVRREALKEAADALDALRPDMRYGLMGASYRNGKEDALLLAKIRLAALIKQTTVSSVVGEETK